MSFRYPIAGPFPDPVQPATLNVRLGRRAIAFWIDGVVISLATGALDQLAKAFSQWPAWIWIVGVISWMVAPVYYIWAYSTSGQTSGKHLMGIKVVSIDGSPLNWRKGVLRFIGYLLSDLSFFLGYLWSIWDADKQAWHDKIAGTRVVPASATDEQVRAAFNQMQLHRHSNAWKWLAGAAVGLDLALVACMVGASIFLTTQLPQFQLHDDEWDRFGQALHARVDPDPHIPSFSTSRDYDLEAGKATNVWLVMEMTYDADCDVDSTTDWCYRLANELVKIVFDNYPHIDEIKGIHVVMTNKSSLGPVDFELTPVDEALTINEWRQRLSISGH